MPEEIIITAPEAGSKKSSKGVIILITLLLIAVMAVYYGLYRMYLQFNPQDVKDYITEASAKYDVNNRAAAYKIIQDGVKEILRDRLETRRVLIIAKVNGTPKELELVHAAVMSAKGYGYLE